MLIADRERMRAFRSGGGRSRVHWQLCYKVWNFAPALQLVAVEQQQPDGTWATVQVCHTIEFQGRAAHRRARIIREHAAPIDADRDAASWPRLRIVVRGIGQVRIGAIELVALRGRRRIRTVSLRAWTTIGEKAPRRGWPNIDWAVNRGEFPVTPRDGRREVIFSVRAARTPS